MNTIFCLVSRQAMANVLPVLMYKPKQVILFATPEEKRTANNLEKLFHKKGIAIIRKDNLDAYDYISFRSIIKNELEKLNTSDVCLNVTGGTKLMALAAYEAFAEKDKSIIYCDTEHQHIISLFPDYKIEELKTDLSIEDYLLSYGYSIKETKDSSIIEKFTPLFKFIEEKNLLKEFTLLLQKSRERNINDSPRMHISSNNKNFSLEKNFDKYSIHFNKDAITLNSSNFKLGDWLEYYVYYLLKEKYNLEPLSGVKIVSDDGVENEIDALVIKDYKLYNYSCKSGKSDNQFDLFQLETLRNITSGTFGKGIFVAAKKGSKKFVDRAKELNIKQYG